MTKHQRDLIEQLMEEFLGDDEWFSIGPETQEAIRAMFNEPKAQCAAHVGED